MPVAVPGIFGFMTGLAGCYSCSVRPGSLGAGRGWRVMENGGGGYGMGRQTMRHDWVAATERVQASDQASRSVWTGGYTFVDYATQAYLVLVGLLILLFHGDRLPHAGIFLLLHLLGLSLVHGLVRLHSVGRGGRMVEFLRHFYPILLYTGLYRETEELNQMFISGYCDPVLARLDAALFGGQPSLDWMERWPWLPVSEVFYAAYFSYYVMIAGVGLALYFRDRRQFFHYVSVTSFIFYICYTVYIFLPAVGPRMFFSPPAGFVWPADLAPLAARASLPAGVQGGIFFQVMAVIYQYFEAEGAAFPSSHVTVAIGTAYFSWIYLRPVRWVHAAVVVLLCLSTVYCRYHYVVDMIAGALLAGLLLPLANGLFHAAARRRPWWGA